MSLRSKLIILLVAVLMGLSGWGGWKLHPDCPDSSISTVVEKERTVIKRPDGTIEEHTKDKSSNSSVVVRPSLPKWSVQADVRAPINKLDGYSYSGYLYRRVSDTNLWVGVGASNKKEISIGIRIDF